MNTTLDIGGSEPIRVWTINLPDVSHHADQLGVDRTRLWSSATAHVARWPPPSP